MDVDSDGGEHSTPSTTPSRSDGKGSEGGLDPWVETRALATQAAGTARQVTLTKKTNRPSRRWPSAAGKLLLELLKARPELPKPSDPAKFCAKWGARLTETGTVHDAPRSGRKPKLPEDVVEGALGLVIHLQPRTQREMNKHASFQTIFQQYEVTAQTLWRHIREAEPRLGKHVRIEFKMPLTAQLKQERCAAVRRWLRRAYVKPAPAAGAAASPVTTPTAPDTRSNGQESDPEDPPPIPTAPSELSNQFVHRIIWIDAKKFYIKPKSYRVWGLAGTPSTVVHDPRVKGTWVVHYYAAVNYLIGGVVLVFVSGTKGKGYAPATKYEVGYDGVKCTAAWRPPSEAHSAPHTALYHSSKSLKWRRTT